ncbi:MAG: tetratricopeptide repeat protein [Candidatus Melainabacteria bacterium]|nr:tetratricopeptide repeat protein [Candidatus Melainabacteria bacterium]
MRKFLKSFLWLPSLVFLLVYAQSLSFGAAFPDDSYVISPLARDFHLMLKTFYDNSSLPGVHFIPVFIFQCFLINKIFGANAYPFGFHLYQYLVQSIVCLLATVIFYKITKDKLISVLIVTLWTVHPINLQQITRLLCGPGIGGFALFLSFLLCFILAREVNKPFTKTILIVSGTIFFLCALLSVEFFFFLPFVLYIIYFYFEGKNLFSSKRFLYLLVPLGVYPVYLIWRYFACGGNLYQTSEELIKWMEVGNVKDILFRTYWLAPQLLTHYFKFFIYPESPIDTKAEWFTLGGTFWSPYSLFCQIFVLCLILAMVLLFRRSPLFSIGLIWFFLSIIAEIQIYPLFSIVGARYFYVSSLGLFLSAFSFFIYYRKYLSSKIIIILIIPIFIFYTCKTVYYLPSSKDLLTQYEWMAKEAPPFLRVFYMNVVRQTAKKLDKEQKIVDWINDESIEYEVNKWLKRYLNLQIDLSYKFGSIQMPYNYNLYKFLCKHLYRNGKLNELSILINQAIKVKNNSYGWYQMAGLLKDLGQWEASWNAMKKAIWINKKLMYLYGFDFIEIALSSGNENEAEKYVKDYVALYTDLAHPYLFAGLFYWYSKGRREEAIKYFQLGISDDKVPCVGQDEYYFQAVNAFKEVGMLKDVKKTLSKVLSFDPYNKKAKLELNEIEKVK